MTVNRYLHDIHYGAGFRAAGEGTPYVAAYKDHAGWRCLVGIAPEQHAEALWCFRLGYHAGMAAIESNARQEATMSSSARLWMVEQSRIALEDGGSW